ncbi:MAG: glycine cleavage system aminomethyltransferase GcvT [Bacteroidota bacterium]
MKKTQLTDKHIALGAKMAAFAGYNMPISYEGIKDEHHCVRKGVGVFDVSHMGEFIIRGKQALDLIQKISSNDASVLEIGQAQYTCIPNKEGGIIDDMLVYRLDEDQCSDGERAYMLVVNASNIEKDWNWIESENEFDTKMINISEHTSLLAVQGPKATQVLQKLTEVNLADIKYYHFTKGKMAGLENVLISATGYTGSGGFELYVANKDAEALWDAVFEAGKEENIQPIGLGARDTLRLEMGFCLYGNDIDDSTSPIEAGLSWITKTKKDDFNSKEIFVEQKANGIEKRLVGFTVDDRRVPRHGYLIYDEEENEIGVVTSGTQSPSLDIPIGLGYVKKPFAKSGNNLLIKAGKKYLKAKTTKLPFYKG